SNLWRWAVYVPQERMREVLRDDVEQRRETIRRALGLERYRTAADNTQLLASELRHRAALLTRSAEGLGHPEQRVQVLDQEIPALERTAGELSERATLTERNIHQLSEDIRVRREALPRFAADRRELDQARHTAEEVRSGLAELDERIRHGGVERNSLLSKLAEARAAQGAHPGVEEGLGQVEVELRA
ncbi:hypothetical protein B1A_17266, partial [mine drainage metagenome]